MNARDVPGISESVVLQFNTSETASTDAHHPKENVTVGCHSAYEKHTNSLTSFANYFWSVNPAIERSEQIQCIIDGTDACTSVIKFMEKQGFFLQKDGSIVQVLIIRSEPLQASSQAARDGRDNSAIAVSFARSTARKGGI